RADGFENFLDTRYKGKKRFGLEGGEAIIPALNEIVELGPSMGVEEYTIGMAHRGRLNVLVNILNKTYDQIFTEFEEAWVEDFVEGGGDVKYHRGYSSDHVTSGGDIVRLTLSPNPSHLEFGHSVVMGRARAKQRLRADTERVQCVPICIHGDASFPGQGIVAEMFNMMNLDGYTVGGTLHFVINNQIGFTTNPSDAHSGTYCTDIAKIANAPIFHVNGDDPEAMAFVARLAIEYRQRFKADVVIDMWCYRKYGHNEGDEPTFTQPLMYERIKKHTPVLKQYVQRLSKEGHLDEATFNEIYDAHRTALDEAQARSRENPIDPNVDAFRSVWKDLTEDYNDAPVETGVARTTLDQVAASLGSVPEGFTAHRKLKKLMAYRGGALDANEPIDWGLGEMLSYGSLLMEGHAVRLTGQDVERGTFSHRHAVLFDQTTGMGHSPLNTIADGQSRFCIHNSPLTESACVGFEYGYSLGDPNMLIIWEAQFGDFANGAQVIFDQFIASAEAKWERCTGLVCLLPHGYEGQGPEHSSARLERFLSLCAHKNMQIVYPTTPAQIFHVMRRQMKRNFRKPLIIMSPKSLLRHPKAVSTVDELVNGRFQHVVDDPGVQKPADVRRLLLCSGKVYYDLMAQRDAENASHVAIVRLEQLYPYPAEPMKAMLARYSNVEDVLWVQEEPQNMGAYRYIEPRLRDVHGLDVTYVGRDANSTPAVASTKMHNREQETIVTHAVHGNVSAATMAATNVAG
ncbi:MAG: 2-oxoglutarate dehydrogenase E1 component, partial [Planctomycetota bacterium]